MQKKLSAHEICEAIYGGGNLSHADLSAIIDTIRERFDDMFVEDPPDEIRAQVLVDLKKVTQAVLQNMEGL